MEKLLLAKIDSSKPRDDNAYVEAEKIQKQFFSEYIDPWIERFLRKVQQSNPLPFYAALVNLTEKFLFVEKTSL